MRGISLVYYFSEWAGSTLGAFFFHSRLYDVGDYKGLQKTIYLRST